MFYICTKILDMNRFLFIFRTILLSLFFLMIYSCKDTTDTPSTLPDTSTIGVSPFQFDVPVEGGVYITSYKITNRVDYGEVTFGQHPEWITDLSILSDTTLTFTVLPNTLYTERVDSLEVCYTDAKSAFVYITQEASVQHPFTFSNLQIYPSYLNVDITPVDKSAPYICRIVTKEYMDSFGVTADQESLSAYDLEYHQIMSNAQCVSMSEYLSPFLQTGDLRQFQMDDLVPNTEYLFFCYHIDPQTGRCLSEIVFDWITTTNVNQIELEFDFEYQLTGHNIALSITPVDYDGYYYTFYYNTEEFYSYFGQDAVFDETVLKQWNSVVDIQSNLYFKSPEEIMEENCFTGVSNFNYSLAAESEYVFYVFAVDSQSAFAASEVHKLTVVTESVSKSDLQIDLSVTNLGSRGAQIHFIPDNDQEEYVGFYVTKQEWDSYGSTQEQKFNAILYNYSLIPKTGAVSYTLTDLTPSTEYVLFAFGYQGEMPSTDIFSIDFATSSDVEGESVMTIDVGTYFDFDQIIARDNSYAGFAGYALLVLDIQITPESEPYYYLLTVPEDVENFTDEEIRIMLSERFLQYTLKDEYVVEFDSELVFVGVAMDRNGNLGPLCKEYFTLSRDGVSDVNLFFNKDYAPKPTGFSVLGE